MFGCSAPGESPPPVSRSTRGTVSDVCRDVMKTQTIVSEVHHDVMKTHTIVSGVYHNVAETHAMVSNIHRTIAKGQERSDGKDLSVSDTHTLSITGCPLTVA